MAMVSIDSTQLIIRYGIFLLIVEQLKIQDSHTYQETHLKFY